MLSKNAMNNMKNRYVAVLKKCRLLNLFGSLAVATALAVSGMAGLAMPSDALAGANKDTGGHQMRTAQSVLVDSTDTDYTIDTNITVTDLSGYYNGVVAKGRAVDKDSITITLNDGVTITLTTLEGNTDYSYLTGIYAWRDSNTIVNNGTITVLANSSISQVIEGDVSSQNYFDPETYAYGMFASGSDNDLTNDGTIEIEAKATGSLTITGSVTASGESHTDATVWATGMGASGDANELTNYGSIKVTSEASATLSVTGTVDASVQTYTFADADAYAYGMGASGDANELTNSGSIEAIATATASGDNADAYAYASSYGMYAWGSDNELANSGSITANSTATGSYAHAYAVGMEAGGSNYDYESGVTSGSTSITNSGSITVTATSAYDAYATGMDAWGADNTVTNEENGTINVTATATDGEAYAVGMYLWSDGTINNFGTINVSASSDNGNAYAYQAYVDYGTTNIGTWTLELGETYGTQENGSTYYVFGVGGFGILNFGTTDDGVSTGATFIITNTSGDGKLYAVADMISIESYEVIMWGEESGTIYTGDVTGYIAEVQSQYDFVEWSIVDEDGNAYDFTNADWEDQYITSEVNLTADNSPTQAAATQTVSTVTGHMTNLGKIIAVQTPSATVAKGPSSVPSGPNSVPNGPNSVPSGPNGDSHEEGLATSTMYADAGGTFTDAGGTSYVAPQAPLWKAFLMPFYSYTSENGGDYSTNMMGLALGASRAVGDDMTLGFHASLSRALSDSDYTESTATSYALGVHGLYNIDGALYLRGQLSGFYSESDLDMVSSTGANALKAGADMDTYGFYAQLAAGYDLVLAPQHRVTPEIALSYMYAHMEGFHSTYYDSTGVKGDSFSMDSEDFDAVYADASVRWTGSYDLGTKWTLEPTVKVGIRQALTDPEVSSTMQFGTTPTPKTTHSDLNETSFTCEAGLTWDMGDVDLSLTYSGEFGDVEYTHMGMFKVEWSF